MKCTRTMSILVVVLAGAALAFGVYPPQVTQPEGKVTLKQADGTVTVNGASMSSGATISTGSTVETGAKSSAVVSLGKLGRVELVPETTVELTYTTSSVTLRMGTDANSEMAPRKAVAVNGTTKILWIVNPGVAGTATTNDGQVITDSTGKTEVTIDTHCGNTLVAVQKGKVELRAGSTVKQIAAGSQDSAGTAMQGCR